MAVLLSVVMAPFGAIADPEFFDEGPMAGRGYPFSESVRVGNILFISGQVGVDENNELVDGGIVGETRQIMSNINGALERRGLAFSDVVKCTVFMADVAEWGEFNTIYTTYFEPPFPARSALGPMVSPWGQDWRWSASPLIRASNESLYLRRRTVR